MNDWRWRDFFGEFRFLGRGTAKAAVPALNTRAVDLLAPCDPVFVIRGPSWPQDDSRTWPA